MVKSLALKKRRESKRMGRVLAASREEKSDENKV